jgi:hypothetical protein
MRAPFPRNHPQSCYIGDVAPKDLAYLKAESGKEESRRARSGQIGAGLSGPSSNHQSPSPALSLPSPSRGIDPPLKIVTDRLSRACPVMPDQEFDAEKFSKAIKFAIFVPDDNRAPYYLLFAGEGEDAFRLYVDTFPDGSVPLPSAIFLHYEGVSGTRTCILCRD